MPPAFTRIQSSPDTLVAPHSASRSISASKCSGRQPVTVTSPRVTHAASKQRPGNDAVGNDLVFDAVQFAHAFDHDRIAAVTRDTRAHGNQKVCKIDDFRPIATSSMWSCRPAALRQATRSSLRRRWACETSTVAPRNFGPRDCAMRYRCAVHVASRCDEGFPRTCRKRAFRTVRPAADLGAAEPSEQCADDIEGCRRVSHERVRRAIRRDVARVDVTVESPS